MQDTSTHSQTAERAAPAITGWPFVLAGLLFLGAGIGHAVRFDGDSPAISASFVVSGLLILVGLYTLQPNQGAVTSAFGSYTGTDYGVGLRWVPFWIGRRKISLRVRNLTSETLKVNDRRGNPIEIAANIVWRVERPAQALYDVEDYLAFVQIQVETALREVARQYAYDSHQEGELSLQTDAETVGAVLREDLQARVGVAGLFVDETHLMHLAYAPEIAGSMLRRQQAEAVLAARRKIVLGAVDMVESALGALSERRVVEMDDERRATIVSNLLVVLCADREPTPVVNTGTLYG